MVTNYNIGDKVDLKGWIKSIHIIDQDTTRYKVAVYDGEAFGCNPEITITEKLLDRYNTMKCCKEVSDE